MSTSDPRLVTLRYAVARAHDDWTLGDETMPEARPHHLGASLVEQQLEGWRLRSGRNVQVGCSLAVRWDEEHPSFGVDPDVYVVEPPPPEGDVRSLPLWKPGHSPPRIALSRGPGMRPDRVVTLSGFVGPVDPDPTP